MSGFPILDLVVGIIFVYFLLSIISSSGVEMILTGLKARATLLEEWLTKIFNKTITQPDGTTVTLGTCHYGSLLCYSAFQYPQIHFVY